jgi:hypothetical protein
MTCPKTRSETCADDVEQGLPRARCRDGQGDPVGQRAEALRDHRLEEVDLGREAPVDRRHADPRALGDLRQAPVDAVLSEDRRGGGEHALAVARRIGAHGPGGRGHGAER